MFNIRPCTILAKCQADVCVVWLFIHFLHEACPSLLLEHTDAFISLVNKSHYVKNILIKCHELSVQLYMKTLRSPGLKPDKSTHLRANRSNFICRGISCKKPIAGENSSGGKVDSNRFQQCRARSLSVGAWLTGDSGCPVSAERRGRRGGGTTDEIMQFVSTNKQKRRFFCCSFLFFLRSPNTLSRALAFVLSGSGINLLMDQKRCSPFHFLHYTEKVAPEES